MRKNEVVMVGDQLMTDIRAATIWAFAQFGQTLGPTRLHQNAKSTELTSVVHEANH